MRLVRVTNDHKTAVLRFEQGRDEAYHKALTAAVWEQLRFSWYSTIPSMHHLEESDCYVLDYYDGDSSITHCHHSYVDKVLQNYDVVEVHEEPTKVIDWSDIQ